MNKFLMLRKGKLGEKSITNNPTLPKQLFFHLLKQSTLQYYWRPLQHEFLEFKSEFFSSTLYLNLDRILTDFKFYSSLYNESMNNTLLWDY